MPETTTQLPDEWQDTNRNPKAEQLGYPDNSVDVFQQRGGDEIVFLSRNGKITTDRDSTVSIEVRR